MRAKNSPILFKLLLHLPTAKTFKNDILQSIMNIKNSKVYRIFDNELLALIWNILLAILVYMACRFLYWAENHQSFSLSAAQWMQILQGGLKFDLSAILYTNILLIILLSFPFHLKEKIHPLIGKIL